MRLLIVLSLAFGVAIAAPLDGGIHGGISLHVPGIGEVGFGGELGLNLGHRKPEPQQSMPLPGSEPHPLGNSLPPHPPGAMREEEGPSHERYPDSVRPGFEKPLSDPMPTPGWPLREPLNPEHPLSDPIPPEMKPRLETGHGRPLDDSTPPEMEPHLEPGHGRPLGDGIPPEMEPHLEPIHERRSGDPVPSEMKPRLEPGHEHPFSDPILPEMEPHGEPGHPLSDPVPPPGLQSRQERSLDNILRRSQRMAE